MRFTKYTYHNLIYCHCPQAADLILEKYPTAEQFIEAYGKDFVGCKSQKISLAELYATIDCIYDKLKCNVEKSQQEWIIEHTVDYNDYVDVDKYWDSVFIEYYSLDEWIKNGLEAYYYNLKQLYKRLLKHKIAERIVKILDHESEPIASPTIIEYVQVYHPDANDLFIKNILSKNTKFVLVGKKGYTLKKKGIQVYSLNECVFMILNEHEKPLQISYVIQEALKIRPDSNYRSLRTVMTILIQENVLSYYTDHHTVGWADPATYDYQYQQVEYIVKRRTVEEGLQELREYLQTYGHLPFAEDEISGELYIWYYRIKRSTTTTPHEMTLLYQFDQMLEREHLPKNKTDYIFKENVEKYIAYIHRNGRFVSTSDNDKLHKWFYKARNRVERFTDFERFHFKRLLDTIDAFQL